LSNIILWAAGIVVVVVAAWRVRAPFMRLNELDQLAENARRYESWRGGHTSGGPGGRTGADEMRDMLRRQVYLWVGAGIVGIIMIVAGFAIR
jgi:hypothetical protein